MFFDNFASAYKRLTVVYVEKFHYHSIVFDDNLKVTSVVFFTVNFNLLSREFDNIVKFII